MLQKQESRISAIRSENKLLIFKVEKLEEFIRQLGKRHNRPSNDVSGGIEEREFNRYGGAIYV